VAGVLVLDMDVGGGLEARMKLAQDSSFSPVYKRYEGYDKIPQPDPGRKRVDCRRGETAYFTIPYIERDIEDDDKPPSGGAQARFRPSEWHFWGCSGEPAKPRSQDKSSWIQFSVPTKVVGIMVLDIRFNRDRTEASMKLAQDHSFSPVYIRYYSSVPELDHTRRQVDCRRGQIAHFIVLSQGIPDDILSHDIPDDWHFWGCSDEVTTSPPVAPAD
jgi:hypothetical protein